MSSYITLPSNEVRALAQRALDAIFKWREDHLHAYLTDIVNKTNKAWYRRLLRLKPVTLAQVKKTQETTAWNWNFWGIKTFRWETEDIATRLLVVSSNHGVFFNVSVEDLEKLHRAIGD